MPTPVPKATLTGPLIIPRPKKMMDGDAPAGDAGHAARSSPPTPGQLDRMAALSVQAELRGRLGLPRLPIRRADRQEGRGGTEIVFGEPGRMPLVARRLREAGATPCGQAEGYCLLVGPRRWRRRRA